MRVLVVTNLYPPTVLGGYEMACAQVVEALRARGHQVRVLTSVPTELPGAGYGDVVRTLRRPDSFERTERPYTRSTFWELEANVIEAGNVFALLRELRAFRPDVCYLWNLIGVGGIGLLGAVELLGVPWVWHLGDAVPAYLCMFEGGVLPVAAELSKRMSGEFICVSQTLVVNIEHVVALGDRIRLLPNWVLDPAGVVERTYYEGGPLRVAYAGRLAEDKGVFVLLEALAAVRTEGHDVRLDLFGRGDAAGVHERIAALRLEGAAQLAGWAPTEELRRRYRDYDLFAFATFERESFGLAPLEAAAEGCVPLVSGHCGLAEWLVDGVDCLKADRAPAAFAAVMARVARGEVDLGPIGRRAASVVCRDFTISRAVGEIEEILAAAARPYRPAVGEDTVYRLAVIAEALARTAIASGAGYLEA